MSLAFSLLVPALFAAAEEAYPNWLEVVAPESVGMDANVLKEIDQVIEQTIAIGHTPGAVVAIGRGNKISFLRGYGYRQFYPEKEEITLDTLFDLASVTKVACTATAIALVIDQGKVSVDDRIIKYFPEFGNSGKDRITVRHCLTHTSGIADYFNRTKGTKEELWRLLCSLPLTSPVGERFNYMDNNTLMLGHIVEKVSGQNLRTFTIENIYRPLGMLDTMHNPDEARRKRAAATETRDGVWYKGVVNDYRSYNLGGVAGHCGLFSTAPDLAILSALWLGKGTLVKRDGSTVRLFNEETYKKMTASQFVTAGVRGLNWDKRSGGKNRPWNMSPDAFGHGGWTGTSIWLDPKRDLFVVVLGNRRHPYGKTPNIYPTAARVGVVAVNSIRWRGDVPTVADDSGRNALPSPNASRTAESLKGRKVGLIVAREEIDNPNGIPARLKQDGVEISALYYPDESSKETNRDTHHAVPVAIKKDARTGAPVYALTRDCPQVLPPMIHDAGTIVFGLRVSKECSEDLFWFKTNVLGHTLQDAADHRLKYVILEYPNPLEKKQVQPTDLTDRLKPFGTYAREARQHGWTFGETAARISEEQQLELEIASVSGN